MPSDKAQPCGQALFKGKSKISTLVSASEGRGARKICCKVLGRSTLEAITGSAPLVLTGFFLVGNAVFFGQSRNFWSANPANCGPLESIDRKDLASAGDWDAAWVTANRVKGGPTANPSPAIIVQVAHNRKKEEPNLFLEDNIINFCLFLLGYKKQLNQAK